MNRFTEDLDYIEHVFPAFITFHECFYEILGIIFINCLSNTYILFVLPFMFGYLFYIYKLTVSSYKEL
jgi:hypothetical protein